MTSTNDGKDVKSNQTSGHKSKSYYIELYTSLEKALSGNGTLEERTAHVCEAWRRVYCLYQHSATSTHPHLLSWLQRHTANTVLQSKWAKSKNEQARLTNAIDALVAEATAAAAGREQHPWEKLLLRRAAWFRKAVENPWDNPVLKSLINPHSEPVTDEQVLEWLISEHGIVLVTRLQRMVSAGNCDDLALLLASAVMDRARAAVPHRVDVKADERVEEEDHSSFVAVLEREASFTTEEWEMLTDIELVLLLKTDKRPRCIELAKLTPLRHGYKMVERLRKRLEMSPRDKKLWKHAKEAATLVAQMVIARCMVVTSCSGAAREALYWCARALARLVADSALSSVCTKLAAPAATARHLHTFCAALIGECKELKTEAIMKPFICELYVRAINTGIYELEKLKLIPEKEAEARLYEQTLAGWFMQLGGRLTDSARLRAECSLTAFSVHPSEKHYQRVANTPQPPRLQTIQEPTPETTSDYGSWANDSRTQSNLVKTSETLQLKQSQQHQANVLSTAILTEGEALGLETELCQDLAVILSGPRVKTLSWDMDREVLLENCRSHMARTHGGTRAVTTELKYLNLDPRAYRHLPEEGDDETDLYYGIEKGYEHEVQFEEPEDMWQNGFFDPEQTESANDSEVDRQMKKKSKAASSEDEEDPLSNIAEAKREKKKLAKEKSKERSKKSHKRDESKDGSRERRKDKDKNTKKERKNKSEQPTPGSLTCLLGMKVSKMSAQVQDGEKRVRKKKERRREPKTMFSYVSVTDSDCSQVKSQVSEHDPNVLVDGVFSMDELGSPEKIIDSQKPIYNTKTTFNNATVQSPVIKDNKTRPMSSPHSTASDSDVSRAKSPYLTPNQLGPRHVVGSKVKSSIAKLLQFRRNKSQVRDVPRPPPSRTPTTNPTHSLVGMKIYKPEDVSKPYLNQTQSKQLEAISKEVCDLLNETSSSVNYRTAPETENRQQNQNLYDVQKYQQRYCNPQNMPQTYNENQKHSEYTQHSPKRPAHPGPGPTPVSSQSPSSVIHTNYTSPIKTPEHMRTHTLNLSQPKQTMAYQQFHKSMQNLSTETKYDPPKKPQLINDPNYFSQQFAKSNSSPLSPKIISNTCVKPPSQTPIQQYSVTVKDNNTTKSPQTYNVHGTNTPTGSAQTHSPITDSKKDVIRYVQQLSISMQNISEVPGRYDAIKTHNPTSNALHGQAAKAYSVKSQNDTSNTSQTLYNSNNSTASRCLPIQHRERADKTLPKPNKNYEEYLKELVKSISESNGHDKNRTVALNKDVKLTPVPSSTAAAIRVDSVTPQCAKHLIQQKKTGNAPNTFSRRSYMHKNKQSENKLSITDSVTLELNRTMMDHKISKAKCMKNEVTISRVGPNKQDPGNVIRKLETPCLRLQRDCPVLSSMLDASETPKIQTVSNTANSNTLGNQPNREDADLLLLLRNQTVLKSNVSTIQALANDTSGLALNNSQIKFEVSSAHQGLVGTKVKNINMLDTTIKSEPGQDKSEWERVMDAIIAQKTEPLGPNALDLALKKQYRRNSQSSSRAHSSDKHRVSGQSSSHNKPVDPKKREHYSSKASSSRKPSTEKHSEIPKKPREPVIKKTTTEMLNRSEILNKHFSSTIPKEVPLTPVIQNSDYDILDDLIDDDLRRELGEISSDEDAYIASGAALLKGKTLSNIPKTVTNVCRAANISKENPHIVNPKTIPKNPNVTDCNRRFPVNTYTTTGYPNVINNSSRPTHTANKPTAVNPETRQHIATPTIITNQVAQDTANNIVTSHIEANQFMSNVRPANVIIASVSQPPVVVIRQDLIYDPYPTIRIHQSQVNAENKNMYALNATPNIAVFQTTQYAAPVINPVIIGNAMTTTNVSNATAMGNDHDTPDRTKDRNKDQDSISLEDAIRLTDNGNQSPKKSTKCLEATISHTDGRSLTPEISTNLDFNMNRNCERKVLSQVQEKHPNDNVDKDSHLKRSLDDIPLKSDEDRIKLKRQSLMNRKISHAVDHPTIPLSYTPLTRKVNLEKQLQREMPKNGIVKPNLISIPNSITDIEKSIVIGASEKSPQSEANNENIESTDQASSVKENQKSNRRIWLRSSNKIRKTLSPAKLSRVPLKRNKIELKVSDKEALKITNVESENKDSVKNLKRVSNRILNKVKVIKPPTSQPPSQEALQQNVADNDELIDFEVALSGTIVLKSPNTMSGIENTTKELICNSTEVEKEESGAAVDEQHTNINSIEDTKVTTQTNKTSDIRLEPTVVIDKLKSKLGDQLVIKRSLVKNPVNKAKVIVVKKNMPVLRKKRIIKKCTVPIEVTSNKIIKEAPKNTVSAAAVPDNTNKLKSIVIIGQKVRKATPISTPLDRVENNKAIDQKVIEHTSAVGAPIPLDDNNKLKPALDDQNEASKLNLSAAEQKVTELITAGRSQPVIETTAKDDVKFIETTATSLALDFVKTNKKPVAMDDQKVIKQTRSSRPPVIVDETNTLMSTAIDNRDIVNQTSSEELPLDLNESNTSKPRAMSDQELIKPTESTPESSTTEQKRHGNDSPGCIKATELEAKNESHTYKTNSMLSSDSEKTSRTVETKPSTVINKAHKIVQSNRSVIRTNFKNSTKGNAESTILNVTGPKPTCILSPQATDDVINHVKVTQIKSKEVIDISETDDVHSTTEVLKYNSNNEITRTGFSCLETPLCQENIEVLNDDAAPKSDVGKDKQDVEQAINLREQLNVLSKPDNPNENFKQEKLKALPAKNVKRPNLTSTLNNDKQTCIKGDIKVVELPPINSIDPSTRLVRLTLPNGKIFRATINGNIQGGFDSLFSDPRMRAILAGSLNDGKRYTVNYKQVCKNNISEIQDLNVKEKPVDTVNLISDDEDEVPTVPARSFTTEFGKYTTNADAGTCTMHQKKFNQKCEVKMCREDIFKSNKTKPKINLPSGSSLLTRNKSKLLSTAVAPVVPSTTTNVMPEVVSNPDISTRAQETPTPNVIEIDDSSNDSIDNPIPKTVDNINLEPVKKLVELKSLLLSDLGVGIDKNMTFPLPKEKAVNNLKSALLQDLGLVTADDPVIDITADDEKQDETLTESQEQNECLGKNPVDHITQNDEKKVDILTGIQPQNKGLGDDSVVQNDERDKKTINNNQEERNLKKCVVKLLNCDNLIKKYERLKTMKKCYVKLERLNNSIPTVAHTSINEKLEDEMEDTDEMNLDTDDFINFDDEEPSGSQQLSRCPSLSILDNWDDDSQPEPLEIPYVTSPVMEIYDTIAQLRNRLKIEFVRRPEKLLLWTCDSEWRKTKLGYSIEERLLRSSIIPTLENKIVPDHDNVLVGGTENLVITFEVPKLVTITLKFLENNPDVLYRLQSMRNLRRILTTKISPNKLKRKTKELGSDTVARKVFKLGTLALNSLNSCIKVLDGISISNIQENLTALPEATSINNESSNRVIDEPLPKDLTTTVENIEDDKQMEDSITTSDIENSEPEKIVTELIAECENNVSSIHYIDAGPVNEDINADLLESVLITDTNMTDDRCEKKCKEDTYNSQESQPEKNTTDQCEEYSYPTVEVTVVHEEANSSEETVPVIDSAMCPGNKAEEEKFKEGTLDSNSKPDESKTALDAQCENYEECLSPAISVALIDEEKNAYADETMAIDDYTTNSTGDRAEEECKERTQDYNSKPEESERDLDAQYENYEDCVSPVSTALIDEKTNTNAEETVANADSNTSFTVEKIGENYERKPEKNTTNEYAQFENNEECLTSPIYDPFLNEDTNAYPEETVLTVESDSNSKPEESKRDLDAQYENYEDCVSPASAALIGEETNTNAEETVANADSNTNFTVEKIGENYDRKPEKNTTNEYAQFENNEKCLTSPISDPFLNEDTNAYPEETVLTVDSDMNQTDIKTEQINDPLVNEDANTYSEETLQMVDFDMGQTDINTEEINDPLVNEDANAHAEETVQTVDSDMSPTDHKTEETNEPLVNEDANTYAEGTVQTVAFDMGQTDIKTEEINDPLVIKDANAHAEETVQTVDSDMSPRYHKTEETNEPLVNEDANTYSEETVQTVDFDMGQTDIKSEEINDPLVIKDANAHAEETVQTVDSNMSPTDHKTEETNEPLVNEDANTYSEETVQTVDFDMGQTDIKSEEISDPFVNEYSNAYLEETVQTVDSVMSPTDHKTEETNVPLVNEDANTYSEETEQTVDFDMGQTDIKAEVINGPLVNEDRNAYLEETVQTVDSVMSPTNNKTEVIGDPLVNDDTIAYSEDTAQTVHSDMSPTDYKTEEISNPLVNEDSNAYLEETVQTVDSDMCPTKHKTKEQSVQMVNEDSNSYSEETVQTVDSDMSPTDHKTEEKYDQETNNTGNFIDDICKEQSVSAHREPNLVSNECETIKIEENENAHVNNNLSLEKSISYLPSESSCDKNVTEDIYTVESPSSHSNTAESGDTESQINENFSDEQRTTEVPHIVNSDRLDEISIDEISNYVYEVEFIDTNIDDGIDIVETLFEKSQEPIIVTTVTSADSSEVSHQDSAIKSPDFIDSKNIAFNYHDYTKQPKNKEDVSTSTINCRPDCEVNNDKDLFTECASETDDNTALKFDPKENLCLKDTPINHTEVNTSENCRLKSNPEFKYELIQEDDLLTVKITTENEKDDNETKTVFIDPNDAEEETVASLSSDEADDNIDIKGFEFEDMYVFPLNQAASNSNNTSNDSQGQESNSESVNDTTQNCLHDIDFHVIEPEITYSRKRKIDMRDIRVPAKKYRKSKNIDCSKQTVISMAELAYGKEYKRLLEYCSSVKFSYTRPFHKECVEVDDLMTNWPINSVSCDVPGDISEEHLFVDLHDISSYQPDPMTQTFVEEINYEYDRTDAAPENPTSKASEENFNMGFGEGSGRVIQILKKGVSNISAATLSDVKQSQPVFKSVDLDDCNTTKKDDQIKKIRQYVNFIELRDKVRTFFKKSSDELKSDWLQKAKDIDLESKCHYGFSREEFPFDLCSLDYVQPLPTYAIVQVVQVGQLPVSAAAQNPVTCDPRVTQVSDASPSQCSVDNSPNDDSQSEIKTEYTELTTADLTLPLQGYAQQNQASLESNDSNLEFTEQTISLEMEIKAEESPEIKKEMPDIKEERSNSSDTDLHTLTNATSENMDYSFETNTARSGANSVAYDSSKRNISETFTQQRQQNGTTEKTDQIAHAMNAAGITTTPETVTNTRAHALVNILSQKIRQGSVNTTQTTTNTYSKTTSINAMALQQALAQILPPPLNQTGSSENNQAQSTPVGPQVLHIVQGKNASGNQITLVDNSQQSVISTPNATQVLHIVQNKNSNPGQASNGTLTSQGNSFSGLSLVDAGLQQGGNQLLHIVNTGNQKNNSPGQLLKRVNLLTNLTNVQGSNEQKMVQFVCKSADGKAIQLNAPHQRSMVLRLQPIETPNVQTPPAKPAESQEPSPSPTGSASSKESASQQEIKSRSIYEENYAKFIQNSSSKTPGLEKSTSLPKFNQAFGKPVFQDGQKQGEAANNNSHLPPVNTNTENTDCSDRDNAINLEHIGQISSPPLLLRKQPVVTSASQPNIVQQIKQTIAPMNIQTMHGGVIYTRQIPVNIGGGQTINLITVPSTELINDDSSKSQAQNNQGEIEPSIIKIVPQSQTTSNNESSQEESNNHASGSNENAQTPQPQPVLTQMRIKLPMLSKAPQMVPGARVVRPSFFQIQRNVIGGNNQPVYQQLVLTAAPPLGQQTIRLPQAQASRPVKAPSESQSSSSESQMSTSTLEQLREFDMVLEQVKERSTVQPSTNSNNSSFKIHTTSSDTTDGNGSSNCSTESTPQVLYSIGNSQSLNVAYVNRKASVTTPTTSTYVRSPDSSGIADSPTSSTHVQIPHTLTTDSSPTEMSQSKPAKVGSKSKSRPKSTSNPPNTLKLNSIPPKTASQKPLEDEQTTQRILYILAEYKEQVENSPDKDKPAPRRRSNPPSNPGSSKRKKSSSSRRSGTRDMSPIHGEDTCRTMGSEDSSCGTSQGDCTESCLDSHSPQDSPRKVARKITFDQELTVNQPRPQPQRNVIVADGQTITVARGTTGKPATAVLMPANYILPVSMMKGGQQIAIVTNRGPKLLTVGGEGGATNALLLQRLIGPAGLKPVLTRPGVRHVRLPTAALHNLQAFNLATATTTTVQPPDSTASPRPGPTPPELVDTRATSSPWTDRDEVKPERGSSPEGSEPWNLPSSADAHEYTYEETVRTDNMDRTVLVVQKKDGSHRQHRLSHVSAAALRHKYAILEHELRLQKSLSEECEDLGVDSPSASELFPEAELLFAASPAHEHNHEHHSHTPQPLQSSIPQPDMDDQIATDHQFPREIDVSLGLGDVGIVAVSEDGSATIALDQEAFARSHPNTTFHSEPTEGEVQPFTITNLKGRHITSTIFHSNAPATVLMTAPQATVISQAPDHSVKYEIENMINSMPRSHNNDLNMSSVLVKDDGLTRFDNILTDSRELHLTNTTSAIVHSSGSATQVIRRVCYEDDKRERDARYLIDEPDNLIAGDDAKMIAEDSSRDATLESMADVDDDRSSPERHAELFWESNSASERSESRRPLDFSSDSDKCCKSPSFDETNSTDSSGVGTHLRLDSVIKEARTRERSGSLDGSSADDAPPLRTYPAKRLYQPLLDGAERSVSGKTRAGERSPGREGVRRRASGRGVVKRGCHCCNGEPAPPRPKKPRQRKPTLDFHATN